MNTTDPAGITRFLNDRPWFGIYTLFRNFGSGDFKGRKRDGKGHPTRRQGWDVLGFRILMMMGSQSPPFPSLAGEGGAGDYESHTYEVKEETPIFPSNSFTFASS